MDLINACKSKDTEKALDLIMNNTNLDIVDSYGRTALMWACHYEMKEVALELIKTGKSNPEHITKDEKTALSLACERYMKEVAYKLVQIGEFTINYLLFFKP